MSERRYIFWPDWKLVLTNIDGTTASKFSYAHNKTYAHIHHVLRALRDANLVTFKKEGRQNIVHLTERGQQIVINFQDIDRLMREAEEQQ